MIRACSPDDVPWLIDLAGTAYPPGTFEAGPAALWLTAMIVSPVCLSARGDHCAGFVQIMHPPYKPSATVADLVHLFSVPKRGAAIETLRLLEFLRDGAFAAGAGAFYLGSILADLGAFARRLGARPLARAYVLEKAIV